MLGLAEHLRNGGCHVNGPCAGIATGMKATGKTWGFLGFDANWVGRLYGGTCSDCCGYLGDNIINLENDISKFSRALRTGE